VSLSLTDTIATVKAIADMGGALVFSVYVAWELRQLRQVAEAIAPKIRTIEVERG